jgi:hypothetical protein
MLGRASQSPSTRPGLGTPEGIENGPADASVSQQPGRGFSLWLWRFLLAMVVDAEAAVFASYRLSRGLDAKLVPLPSLASDQCNQA